MAPTIRINISESKVVTGNNITTVAANGNNVWTNYNNTASLIDPDKSASSKAIDSTLGGIGMGIGITQTADMLATPAGLATPPSGSSRLFIGTSSQKTWLDLGDLIIEPIVKGSKEYAELEKEVAKAVKEMWEGFKEGVKKAKEAIEKTIESTKEGWGNLVEKIADISDHIAGDLPRWLGLNRNGKHYFYDPLVLDLDGDDGIETLGHNKKQGAMFGLECVNDGIYGLVV